jgi:hypothetical protein
MSKQQRTEDASGGVYLSFARTDFGSAMLQSSTISTFWSSAAVQIRALNASARKFPVLDAVSKLKEERSHSIRHRASA